MKYKIFFQKTNYFAYFFIQNATNDNKTLRIFLFIHLSFSFEYSFSDEIFYNYLKRVLDNLNVKRWCIIGI